MRQVRINETCEKCSRKCKVREECMIARCWAFKAKRPLCENVSSNQTLNRKATPIAGEYGKGDPLTGNNGQ